MVHAHVLRLPCGIWAHFLARARTHKQFNAGYQAHQLTADSCTRGPEHSAQRGAQSSSKSSAGRVPGPASPIDPLSRKPATSAELLPLVDLCPSSCFVPCQSSLEYFSAAGVRAPLPRWPRPPASQCAAAAARRQARSPRACTREASVASLCPLAAATISCLPRQAERPTRREHLLNVKCS